MEGRPFEFVAISVDENLELARRTASKLKLPGTQLWAGPKGTAGPLPEALQVPSWPFFLLVDADGVVRWRSHRFDGLPEAVERAVAAAAKPATKPLVGR